MNSGWERSEINGIGSKLNWETVKFSISWEKSGLVYDKEGNKGSEQNQLTLQKLHFWLK